MELATCARSVGTRREVQGQSVVEVGSEHFALSPVADAVWCLADGTADVDVLHEAVRAIEPSADKGRVFALLDELARAGLMADVPAPPAEPMVGRRALFRTLAVGAAVAVMAPAVVRASTATGSTSEGECTEAFLWMGQEQSFKSSYALRDHASAQLALATDEHAAKMKVQTLQEQQQKQALKASEQDEKSAATKAEQKNKDVVASKAQEQENKISARADEQKEKAPSQEQASKIEAKAEQDNKLIQASAAKQEQTMKLAAEQDAKRNVQKAEETEKLNKSAGAQEEAVKVELGAQESLAKAKSSYEIATGDYDTIGQDKRLQAVTAGYGTFGVGRSVVFLDAFAQTVTGSTWLEAIRVMAPSTGCMMEFHVEIDSDEDVRPLVQLLRNAVPGEWDIPDPSIAMQWGRQAEFAGIFTLASLAVQHTGFKEDGTPVRAVCRLSVIPV